MIPTSIVSITMTVKTQMLLKGKEVVPEMLISKGFYEMASSTDFIICSFSYFSLQLLHLLLNIYTHYSFGGWRALHSSFLIGKP